MHLFTKNPITKLLDPTLTGNEAERLDHNLKKRIIGQVEAIATIVSAYQTYLAGMNAPGRPVSNFLFLGPTGSGKTRTVEALAESLVGDARAVIKIDCAEFQHSHEVAKLIGSPPGYLGHRETHPLLSQEVLNLHHTEKVKLSFVLFDEIEKASDALWNLLLGILDKAILTLGDNRRVDFSRSMIFMTSNLGATEIQGIFEPRMGFSGTTAADYDNLAGLESKIAKVGIGAAKRKFTPEFINRIDKIVVFKPLGRTELYQVLDLELAMVQRRIFTNAEGTAFVIKITSAAKDFLLNEGYEPKYGARHLKRAIERSLVYPMSNLIASGQVRTGDVVRVDYDIEASRLAFSRIAEGMPAHMMVQEADPKTVTNDIQEKKDDKVKAAGARSTRK